MTRVGIIGAGRFGSAFAGLLSEAGHTVAVYDPQQSTDGVTTAASAAELASVSEVIVLAVPVGATAAALQSVRTALGPDHVVMDVGSVKLGPERELSRVLGDTVPWVATHPLFGPASLARGERPLIAVVCPNETHPGAAATARRLYESAGCDVVETDADSHDHVMANTHALAFFIAKAMLRLEAEAEVPFAPPSFQAMARTIETVRSDAGHLFFAIHHGNVHAAHARKRLLEALAAIDRELAEVDDPAAEDLRSTMAITMADECRPSTVAEMIEEIDGEIEQLRARRERLSSRLNRS